MRPGTFYGLAGVTAIAVVAAAIAVTSQTETTSLTAGTEPAFPKLSSNVNDVARIEIRTPKASFSIGRNGDGWGMDQKGGYPVEFEKVKSAIVSAAEFKLIERKTSDPKRYERLDLAPPDSPEAKSKALAFKDKDGNVLADVLVGKENPSLFGSGGAGTYIRRGDEKQTWLVRGRIQVGEEPNNWMIRQIVNYGKEKVRHVTITRPDGSEFSISKEKQENQNFVLKDIPDGKKLKNPDEVNPLGGVTWRMMFDDVIRADEQDWPKENWIGRYTTWSGIVIRIEVAKIGDDHWGRFQASLADDVTDAERKAEAQKTVEEINKRTDGWSYMLTAGDAEKLTSKKADYLVDAKKKEGS